MEGKSPKSNPFVKASFISRVFFLWLFPLIKNGPEKELRIDDLYSVLEEDESGQLGNQLQEGWNEECRIAKKSSRRPRYYKPILALYFKQFALYGCAALINECVVSLAQVLFLYKLIGSFMKPSPSIQDQLFYGTGIVLSSFINVMISHPLLFKHTHIGMKCRVASCSMIYQKALRLSKSAQSQTTVGQMVNLLSNDLAKFDASNFVLHYLYIGPLQMVIFAYFMWTLGDLGVSCLAGIGFVVFLMPIQYCMSKMLRGFRLQIAQRTDRRSQIMNEIIIAIRVIKMYAWEKPFTTLVDSIRRAEVGVIRKSAFVRALFMSTYVSSAKLISYFTILVFTLRGGELKPDTIFFMVSMFNVIRQTMVRYLPSALATVGDLMVTLNRIEAFLLLDEHKAEEPLKVTSSCNNSSSNDQFKPKQRHRVSVRMTNVCASWTAGKPTLEDINVNIVGSELVMVIGPVGSGKTSFLHTLMGELLVNEGNYKVSGKTVYDSQEPWILPGNLKENILVGQPFNKNRFSEVLHMSALEEDLKQLPFGENTIVGERGIALSGGQKVRVNLARALYRDADIYLLDDPLSAVDTQVSRHIFEKCIRQQLKQKLRILVTHQLQYLPKADHIIVFNSGKILAQGTHAELVAQGIDFVGLILSETEETKRRGSLSVAASRILTKFPSQVEDGGSIISDLPTLKTEQMAGGSVTWKTYLTYLQSGKSKIGLIFLCLCYNLTQVFFSGTDYWLSYWISQSQKYGAKCRVFNPLVTLINYGNLYTNLSENNVRNSSLFYETYFPTTTIHANIENSTLCNDYDENFYFFVYTILVIVVIIFTITRALHFFQYCMGISINIHNQMFTSIIRAPMRFFDDNPSGRILNRFTSDIGAMDEILPPIFFDALTFLLMILGINVVIVILNYYIILPCVLLILVLYFTYRRYLKIARNIKRIESVARSPVFTHLAVTFQGLTTIRSSGYEKYLTQNFYEYLDSHSRAWFVLMSMNRWFALWIELIALIFLLVVTHSFMILAGLLDLSDSSRVGLAISSAIAFSGTFTWFTRQSAETENLMTSVERVLEYSRLEPEESLRTKHTTPPENWPQEGGIKFQNVFLAYENKHVLKDLTFEIRPQNKIGIIGRTGAGKSSIVASLFRTFEPTGDIFIDDIRTSDIALHDLRQSISIIPQDPVLFSGTIRYNLDPFNQFKDEELWKVIEEVELKDAVPALDFQVSDCGSNFSVGEKQLVCLARAILRQNKIIVMDEATANVDPRTDKFIQTTIRSKFSQCTIITIAHRLHSVIDCDRILVLENGYLKVYAIKEYGHPNVLLQNPDGYLTAMVAHMGKANSTTLAKIAEETFIGRRGSFQAGNVSIITSIQMAPDILVSSTLNQANPTTASSEGHSSNSTNATIAIADAEESTTER